MMISRGKPKKLREILLQCHFIQHDCLRKTPGIEPEAPL
jgi:hypothetical protein